MELGPFLSHYIQPAPAKRIGFSRSGDEMEQRDQVARVRKWRIAIIASIGVIFFALMGGRLWQLQIIQGDQSRQASAENSLALKIIPAPRGLIYDANGQVLARNEPSFRLAVTYAQLPTQPDQRDAIFERIAKILKIEQAEVASKIEQAKRQPFLPVAISAHIDRDTQRRHIIEVGDMPGVSFEQNLRRNYQMGQALSHVIGYTGAIQQKHLDNPQLAGYHPGEETGLAGLEQQYESYLHGQPGRQFSQVNALGQSQDRQSRVDPQPGDELHLSLDADLQKYTYDTLMEAVKKHQTRGAAAIIQDVSTGGVISLISAPGYDANAFARGVSSAEYLRYLNDPLKPLFNRAIAGTYPPGSTVKTVVAAAAVQEGVITKDTIVHSPNQISVGGSTFADWTYWLGRSGPGNINVVEALAQSTDTFFYKVGGGYEQQPGMGVDALFKYYTLAGLGNRTGVDLPGESKGVVPNPAWKAQQFPDDPTWYVGNTYQLSIGQSYLLTTPLQINSMTNAIANDGKLMQPHLVTRITSPVGEVVKEFTPQVMTESIASNDALEVAREGMVRGVEHGIIFPLRDNPYQPAAKTGTAEFGNRDVPDQYGTHSWVTGYAPHDRPQLSFTILLEGGGSSTNAAEVASDILEWYHQHLNPESKNE